MTRHADALAEAARPKRRSRALSALASAGAALALSLSLTAPAGAVVSSGIAPGSRLVLAGGNSPVASAHHGTKLYLAGSNLTGVGVRANLLGAFDATTGTLETAWPELFGFDTPKVTAIAPDAAGGAFIAGTFAGADGLERARLLHFSAARTVDMAFAPTTLGGASEAIDALALSADGATLYVGGTISAVNGQPRTGVAALDASTGAVRAWNPRIQASSGTPQVTEIAVADSGVYVTGGFDSVADAGNVQQPRENAAELASADGSVLAWNPRPDEKPTALAVGGSRVYLAGPFASVGGTPVSSRLVAVDATSGALDAGWLPAPNSTVHALAVSADDTTVFAGGSFTAIGEQAPQATRSLVAAIDATSGEATAWDASLAGTSVRALAVSGTTLYVTGEVVAVGATARCGAAAFATTDAALRSWNPALGVAFDSSTCSSSAAGGSTLAVRDGRVWVGGELTLANAIPRLGNAAAIDLATDTVLDWAPSLSAGGAVNEIAISGDGDTAYLGGTFSTVNGVARSRAAAVGTSGAADQPGDVDDWDPAPSNTINAIALSPDDNTVYLGGSFRTVRGPGGGTTNRSGLAAFDAAGDGEPTSWNPAPTGGFAETVRDVVLSGNGATVYVGGRFNSIGAVTPETRPRVAALSAADGTVTSWRPVFGTQGTINDLALDESAPDGPLLYVGGTFASTIGAGAEPPTRTNLAALRTSDAEATAWAPEPNAQVRKLSVDDAGTVYVATGADFTIGSVPRRGVASITRGGVVTDWAPPVGGDNASEARFVGGRVVMSGSWTSFGGLYQNGLLLFGDAIAPSSLSRPTLSISDSDFEDAASVDATLTCVGGAYRGSWPFQASYRWLRDGTPIAGQTGSTYVATGDDGDHDVGCEETVANEGGDVVQTSETVRVLTGTPEVDTPPELVGTAQVGQQVSCTTGVWRRSPSAYAYRWLLDGSPIAGESRSTLLLAAAHEGRTLRCEVVASNAAGGGTAALTTGVVVMPAPRREDPRTEDPRREDPRTEGPRTGDPQPRVEQPQPRPQDPPASPSAQARVSLGRLTFDRRRGQLVLSVRPSAPGVLTITLTARQGRRRIVVGRGRARAAQAGRAVVLKVQPTRAGRRALRAGLRIGIRVSLRPSNGSSAVVKTASASVG